MLSITDDGQSTTLMAGRVVASKRNAGLGNYITSEGGAKVQKHILRTQNQRENCWNVVARCYVKHFNRPIPSPVSTNTYRSYCYIYIIYLTTLCVLFISCGWRQKETPWLEAGDISSGIERGYSQKQTFHHIAEGTYGWELKTSCVMTSFAHWRLFGGSISSHLTFLSRRDVNCRLTFSLTLIFCVSVILFVTAMVNDAVN